MDTDQTDLFRLQLENLSADELTDFIFELGIDPSDFSSGSRTEMARELVLYMERAGKLAELRDKLPRVLDEIAPKDKQKALQTLHVHIPMASHVIIEDFLSSLNHTLRALNNVYFVLAAFHSKAETNPDELSFLITKDYQARLVNVLNLGPAAKAQEIHVEFEAAQSVQDDWIRAVILNELVPYLSEEDRKIAFLQAVQAVEHYTDEESTQSPWGSGSLLQHLLPEPIDRQQYAWISGAWIRMLRTLAPHLSEADRARALEIADTASSRFGSRLAGTVFWSRPNSHSDRATLKVKSCHYGSPVTLDLLGIAGVIEEMRNLIKDLAWRGSYEKETANLDKQEREILLEQKRLENDEKRLDILLKHVEVGERLLGSKLKESDRVALMTILAPQVHALLAAEIAPDLNEPS